MSVVVRDMAAFGDSRSRDLFNRNVYQTVAASSATTAVTAAHNFYGVTAATGSAHGSATQFELAKIQAVESAADGFASSFNVQVNSGAGATVDSTVASLSSASASFVASQISADFGSSFTDTTTKGFGRDGTTAAVIRTLNPGGTGAVVMRATPNRLHISATDTQVQGNLTVQGDNLNWAQSGGTSGYKLSAANDQYVYTHGSGTNSTGVRTFNLDGFNVDNTVMASGGFAFNSFNSTGAAEPVMSLGGGAAAGQQLLNITNSFVGIGTAATSANALAVSGKTSLVGDTSITGNLVVSANLTVNGTVTTVNSTSVNVTDKTIDLASNTTASNLFAGGGIALGSGSNAVHITYDDVLKAWSSDISYNAASGFNYLIAGGSSSVGGVTLSASQLAFNSSLASLNLGTGVTLDKSQLYFSDPTAILKFGTVSQVSQTGFSSTSDAATLTLGANKDWRMAIESINSVKYLSLQYSSDGGSTYTTKFSVSP